MVLHTLKLFTTFIFVVAFINFTYYASYWKYSAESHALRGKVPSKIDIIYRNEPKMNIPLIKVILMRGPKRRRIKKKIKVNWTPEYVCGENATNSRLNSVSASPQAAFRTENKTSSSSKTTDKLKPLCPEVPSLLGPTNLEDSVKLVEMNRVLSMLKPGGSYAPSDCIPTETVAIIAPYRGEDIPLNLFVYSVHLAVIKQKVAYQIFIIKERNETKPFNPGLLYNIGFIEALKIRSDFTCIVFHEPYLAPADSNNLYRCSEQPKQLVASVDTDRYENEFGGVIAMRPQVFRKVNGFSNQYLGNEDVFEEIYQRLIAANYTIGKSSPKHAAYNSLLRFKLYTVPITQSTPAVSAVSNSVVASTKELPADGLTALSYSMSYHIGLKLYTLIEVQDSTLLQKPMTVTISTKSSNPLYDETTTPSTTTKPVFLNLSLRLRTRTRILGL